MNTLPSTYYPNEELHGNYQYIFFEDLVNNFMQNYTGDETLLGNTKRHNVIYEAKQGIRKLTFDALRVKKSIELELGDNYDIILPPDYVDYIRVSWLDQNTGEFRPMAKNDKLSIVSAYLQDWKADILFDNNGYILEGTSATEIINNKEKKPDWARHYRCGFDDSGQLWGLNTGKNYNGEFVMDDKRMHFGTEMASKIIILEYISDGLAVTDEREIKVHKFAEMALYAYIHHQIASKRLNVSRGDKLDIKREWDTQYRNTKVRMLGVKIAELTQRLKYGNQWFK